MGAKIVITFQRWIEDYLCFTEPEHQFDMWEHYENEAKQARDLKLLFEKVEKFNPSDYETVDTIVRYFNKL